MMVIIHHAGNVICNTAYTFQDSDIILTLRFLYIVNRREGVLWLDGTAQWFMLVSL